MMFKKGIALFLAFWISLSVSAVVARADNEGVPGISSPSYVLIDVNSGQMIAKQNEAQTYNAGSMTKILSLLLFYDALQGQAMSQQGTVTISPEAAGASGLRAFFDSGEKSTVEVLMHSVIMASANDACIALAETVAGSEAAFVEKMNERAKDLGLKNTKFENCTGYNAKDQTTTAEDMALLASLLVTMPGFSTSAKVYMEDLTHESGRITELVNPNRLVRFYDNCDGVHVGSTNGGGYCGAMSASKGGMRLIAVVMGAVDSQKRFDDARALLEYGFANFTSVNIVKNGDVVKKNITVQGGRSKAVKAVAGEDLAMLLPKSDASALQKEIKIQEDLEAPIKQGQQIGELVVKVQNQDVVIPLLADQDVPVSSLMYYFKHLAGNFY